MDEAIMQELRKATKPDEKAAIIAEAVLNEVPEELALVARRCVVLHWFDLPVVEALLQDIPSVKNNAQYVYEQLRKMPFIESLAWGLTFQNLTREGLLKRYTHSQPELLRVAARLAASAYEVRRDDGKCAAEALFCHIIAGDVQAGTILLNELLEQAASRQDWQYLSNLLHLQEEAESLSFVQPLPRTEQYWMLGGLLHRMKGQLGLAIADYNSALAINPKSTLAYINRGTAYAEQRNYSRALMEYKQALSFDPTNVVAYCNKGTVLSELGEYREALHAYEQALRLEPNSTDAQRGRNEVLTKLNHQQQASAESRKTETSRSSAISKRGGYNAMIDRSALRVNLDHLANRIDPYAAAAARRLRFLESAIEGGPNADVWTTADIYEMIDPDAIVETFRKQPVTGRFFAILTWLRNTLILAPLIVTWIGITQAVEKYNDLLRSDPSQSTKPFVLLWQQGFGGRLPSFFTLSNITFVDGALLVAILLLTFILYAWSYAERSKKEREAGSLRASIDDALANATILLRARALVTPSGDLGLLARRMIEELRAEQVHLRELVSRREKEFGDLAAFTSKVSQASSEMLSAAQISQRTNETLATGINNFINPIRVLSDMQEKILSKLNELTVLFQGITNTQQNLVANQNQWSTKFVDSLDELDTSLAQLQQFVATVEKLTAQQASFIQNLGDERKTQENLAKQLSEAALTVSDSLHEVRNFSTFLRSIAVDMKDLAELQRSLPDFGKNLLNAILMYTRTADSMNASSINLFQASRELERVISELEKHITTTQE